MNMDVPVCKSVYHINQSLDVVDCEDDGSDEDDGNDEDDNTTHATGLCLHVNDRVC